MRRVAAVLVLAVLWSTMCFAQSPVYVVLFFHVADPLSPQDDDAVLRLAEGLHDRGIRATFQLTGEKARLLEARHRQDVIRALSHHDIGYHGNFHSLEPVETMYLRDMGWLEGAAEFERREVQGVTDMRRIFGANPSVYSEGGFAYAPQCNPALVHMGIRIHINNQRTVGLSEQPFWFDGVLQLCGLQRFFLRFPSANNDINKFDDTQRQMDRVVEELRSRGGGTILMSGGHTHDFVTAEGWWHLLNVPYGMVREPGLLPPLLSKEESERRFRLFFSYVDHVRNLPGVEIVTVRQLLQLYENPVGSPLPRSVVAEHMLRQQNFLETKDTTLSAAEQLLILLGMKPREVEGPIARHDTTYQGAEIPRWAFENAKADTVSFIQTNHRLPSEAWIGSQRLSILDFAATLAGDDGKSPSVTVRKGNPEMEKYWPLDPVNSFKYWAFPKGFSAPRIVELNRLQAWTLKPARFR
jgi:hypothetical protein